MKKFTYSIALISFLAIYTSCDKDNVHSEEFRQEIEISTDVSSTKADGTDTYQGDNLGLFIDYGNTAPSQLTMSNIRWDRNGSYWTPAEQMLWKDASTRASLYAYAPYTDGQNDHNNIVFTIPGDQKDGVDKADLVSWTRTDFTPDISNPDFVDGKVQINFSHRLIKLTVNITTGTGITSDVSISGITLLSTAEKASLSLDSQSIVGSQGSLDISMHKISDTKYEAVFYPGNGQDAGARMLYVLLSDGSSYNFTVPASGLIAGGLQTGKSYEMNLRIGKDKIEIDSEYAKVTDWSYRTPIDGGKIKPVFAGTGTAEDPFLISNEDELRYFSSMVDNGHTFYGQYIKLSNAIHINGDFTPIGKGNMLNGFEGHFDGADMGVYMDNANLVGYKFGNGYLFGFFFRVKGRDSEHMASIENLQLYSANLSGYTSIDGGLLCYSAQYAVIKGSKVEGNISYNTSTDISFSNFAGIAQTIYYSTVENCTSKITFSHTGAGGKGRFCGLGWDVNSSTIRNCEIEMYAAQEYDLCGISDYAKNITVESTTVSGHFDTVKNYIAGMFGGMDGTVDITDCIVKAKLAKTNGTYGCGGLVSVFYEDCTGKFERCAFVGSFDNYSNCHYIVVSSDDSSVKFKDCWYSKDAYANSNKKMSTNITKNYGFVEKN